LNNPTRTQQLAQARRLYGERRFADAEAAARAVLDRDGGCREALELLVMLALQAGNADAALDSLRQLVATFPDEPLYCDRLARLYERRGMQDRASACYQQLLARRPALLASRFNYAALLRRCGRDAQALAQYRRCLRDGIDDPEQVLSNIGSILADLHRDAEAEQAFNDALVARPGFVPALYNLALLREEHGDWPGASNLFRQVLDQQPGHAESLVRLAQGHRGGEDTSDLLAQIDRRLDDRSVPAPERESLAYGKGKLLDDIGAYPQAFDSYNLANSLSRERAGPYRKDLLESLVDRLVAAFDDNRHGGIQPVADAPLLFICGMFRSGSTLLEQMLAAHPALTSGGELSFFQRNAPLPVVLGGAEPARWQALGADYESYLVDAFGSSRVINKRPDNFLYLGLIHSLFPNARILLTRRQPLDNCLSVYFQQLDDRFTYANDLIDSGHYFLQHRRLMACWQERFGDRISTVDYEELVTQPRTTLEPVLEALQLGWDDACLEFHTLGNRVRTASVAQVRQPLYAHACGRWRNYEQQLQPLRDYLAAANGQ
jgi:tetratricopeptide (TPR) repeat protein